MNVSVFCDGLIKIKKDNTSYLGIKIFNRSKPDKSSLSKAKENDSGLLIHKKTISEWEILGTLEYDGRYRYGKFIEGESLSNIISNSSQEISCLKNLVEGIAAYFEKTSNHPRIQTNGIIFTRNNGLLFLHPGLMKKNLDTLTEKQKIMVFFTVNHPDLKGEESLSFSLGVISYILITGEYPLFSKNVEELQDFVRNKKILPPKYILPELDSRVSEFITTAILGKNKSRPTLQKWIQEIASWEKSGIRSPISMDEKNRLLKQGKQIKSKIDFQIRVKNIFRKYYKIFLVALFGLILTGVTTLTILKNILAPPLTMNMSPVEVVESFYTAQNEFNHELIEDCLSGNAGKKVKDESELLFISSRFSKIYEKENEGIIIAQEWLDGGKPELSPLATVYGVANLKITKKGESIFIAEYDKFYPDEAEKVGRPLSSRAYHIKEKLFLKTKNNKYWNIYKIEEIESFEVTDSFF